MPHPVHQLSQRRPSSSREGISGVAKIMKVKILQADRAGRWPPYPGTEVPVTQRHAPHAGENQALVALLRKAAHMPLENRNDHLRDGDRALACLRFGRPERKAISARLGQLPNHPDSPCLQVDVASPECGQLSPAQASEAGQEDKRPVTLVDCFRQREDLRDGEYWRLQ